MKRNVRAEIVRVVWVYQASGDRHAFDVTYSTLKHGAFSKHVKKARVHATDEMAAYTKFQQSMRERGYEI